MFAQAAVRGMIAGDADDQIFHGNSGKGRIEPFEKVLFSDRVEIMGTDIRPLQMNKDDLMLV